LALLPLLLLLLPLLLQLLLALLLLLLLLRRRLTISALHSLSLGTRFISLGCPDLRRDRLPKFSWRTSATLTFTCPHRRRGAEPCPLILTLWRILWRLTLPWTLLLPGPFPCLTILFLLLRLCIPGRCR
jgi:hypothetical protein